MLYLLLLMVSILGLTYAYPAQGQVIAILSPSVILIRIFPSFILRSSHQPLLYLPPDRR